jgi:GNAT superfamily N-acetyltransferase
MLIRPAIPEDALAVARVHVCSWQAAYRSLMPDEYLDQLRAEDRAAKYDFTHADPQKPYTQVAECAREIVGFVTTMPTIDGECAGAGELLALYVDPAWWGKGSGRDLAASARQRMIEQGHSAAILWILEGNMRADRFYRIDGWLPDGTRKQDTLWGIAVTELRYRRALP